MTINSPDQRRQTLAEHSRREGIDTCIISDPRHVCYLTQFAAQRPRFSCFLLVNANGESTMIMGEAQSSIAEQLFNERILTFKDYDIHERMVAYAPFVSKELAARIREARLIRKSSVVGIEYSHLPYVHAQEITKEFGLRPVDISGTLMSMRKVKGLDEQLHIMEACTKIDSAYQIARSNMLVDNSEINLFREVTQEAIKRYGPFHGVGGDTWISGERSLLRSGQPTNRKFKKGETIILDLQATSNQYWADTCRTFVIGEPSKKQMSALDALVRAKEKGENLLMPGAKGSDIYEAVQGEIVAAGYGRYSPDHIGHGVGLEDQEPPFFLPNSNDELEEGMVCAIEPGVFDPAVGGMRIEDNYIITRAGYKKISHFPIELC